MYKNHTNVLLLLLTPLLTFATPNFCHFGGPPKPYQAPAVKMNHQKAILLNGFIKRVEILNRDSELSHFEKSHYKLTHSPQNVVILKYHIQPKRGAILPFDNMIPIVVIDRRKITSTSSSKRILGNMFVAGEEVILVTDRWKFNGKSGELHIEVSRNSIRRNKQVFKAVEKGDIPNSYFPRATFANAIVDNVKISYWQYIYIVGDKTLPQEHREFSAKSLIFLPPFQKKHEGYKLYKKMIDENFPNYSKFKLRKLYSKHFYRARW